MASCLNAGTSSAALRNTLLCVAGKAEGPAANICTRLSHPRSFMLLASQLQGQMLYTYGIFDVQGLVVNREWLTRLHFDLLPQILSFIPRFPVTSFLLYLFCASPQPSLKPEMRNSRCCQTPIPIILYWPNCLNLRESESNSIWKIVGLLSRALESVDPGTQMTLGTLYPEFLSYMKPSRWLAYRICIQILAHTIHLGTSHTPDFCSYIKRSWWLTYQNQGGAGKHTQNS